MKVGGKCAIIVPANLAYGNAGADKVPSNAIILIEFEGTKVK